MVANRIKPFKEDLCALQNAHGGNNKAASHWFQVFKECWKPPGNTRWWADLELMTLRTNLAFAKLQPWRATWKENAENCQHHGEAGKKMLTEV